MSLLSIPEAARELHLHPSRVRALVAAGRLPATKIGGRWVVEAVEIARRRRNHRPAGRPFKADNAWGILFLASELHAPWLEPGVRWRLEQSLAFRGLAGLRPRLENRSQLHRFYAHPGELKRIFDRRELVRSGISAAGHYQVGLLSGEEVDGYIRARDLERLQRDHAFQAASGGSANVVLRVVPDDAWHLDLEVGVAPLAAVAVDLAEDPDSRSARKGNELIAKLDRTFKASR